MEEIDHYLDDGYLQREEPMDRETVAEMEEFMNERLPKEVRKNLKKLERK